ncbi:MAG: hypothetical protein V5A62_04315 [Haloarculaceae archaeon]
MGIQPRRADRRRADGEDDPLDDLGLAGAAELQRELPFEHEEQLLLFGVGVVLDLLDVSR